MLQKELRRAGSRSLAGEEKEEEDDLAPTSEPAAGSIELTVFADIGRWLFMVIIVAQISIAARSIDLVV